MTSRRKAEIPVRKNSFSLNQVKVLHFWFVQFSFVEFGFYVCFLSLLFCFVCLWYNAHTLPPPPPPMLNCQKGLFIGLKGQRHHCTGLHATSSEKASIQRQSENEHVSNQNQNFIWTLELLVENIIEQITWKGRGITLCRKANVEIKAVFFLFVDK